MSVFSDLPAALALMLASHAATARERFGRRRRQRAGKPRDQCRFVARFGFGRFLTGRPSHPAPAGPARGSAIVLRKPG